MKKRFREKHPYMASICVAVLCTFMTALGMAIPQILNLGVEMQLIVATIFLVLSVFIGIIIIKSTKLSFADCGFRTNIKRTYSKVWYYIPLILMEILPILLAGFSSEITVKQYVALLFFVIAVGFNEEIYFRGIVYNFLLVKGRKTAIIVSSIIFGILHLANAFNGKSFIYLILQMIFAFLVGFVLAEIISITKSLWLLIIWHATHDYIASIGNEDFDMRTIIILVLQVLILLIYAIYMWKVGEKNTFKKGSPMRRTDREIKDFNKIIEIIKKCDVCRIALNDNEYPYILPLNFGMKVEDETIILYFHGATEGKKYELMSKNNKASFEMDCSHRLITDEEKGNCTMEYESVIGQGVMEIVPDKEKYEALCVLMKHYHKEDFDFNQEIMPQTIVFKLTVKEYTAKARMVNN